jgi:drug/metabolite transporter (DMT)-like permease
VNRRKAELALLFNVVIWGTTFVLVKSALHEISPVLFLAIRFSLATSRSWWFSAAPENGAPPAVPASAGKCWRPVP